MLNAIQIIALLALLAIFFSERRKERNNDQRSHDRYAQIMLGQKQIWDLIQNITRIEKMTERIHKDHIRSNLRKPKELRRDHHRRFFLRRLSKKHTIKQKG